MVNVHETVGKLSARERLIVALDLPAAPAA
jgi:hypothetical protein